MLHSFEPVYGRIRLERDRPDILVKFFKPAGCADKGSRRAQTRHKMRYAAARLIPDLGSRGRKMGSPIRRIVVLVRIEIFVRIFFGKLAGNQLRSVRTRQWIGFDDLGAVKTQDLLAGFTGVSRK